MEDKLLHKKIRTDSSTALTLAVMACLLLISFMSTPLTGQTCESCIRTTGPAVAYLVGSPQNYQISVKTRMKYYKFPVKTHDSTFTSQTGNR
jgi:hypothetical protein